MNRAIEAGGTTIRSYLNALGESGGFQVALHVYQQTGKPCIRCGTPIVKTKVAQRGTHYCPNCQRLKIRTACLSANWQTMYTLWDTDRENKSGTKGDSLLSELSKAENRKVGFVLGLTGGIATGKSTAAKVFQSH